jgi:hypothetical protein
VEFKKESRGGEKKGNEGTKNEGNKEEQNEKTWKGRKFIIVWECRVMSGNVG